MKPEEIKMEDVRAVEQSILDDVSRICEENGLRYSLTYGTLLGAVRHGGFIPWDDDVDISMPREDYDKLMELWPKLAPQHLILDRCDLDPENHNVFSKIRMDHTTFLQQSDVERDASHHKGIFIDIFPADRVPERKSARFLQYIDFSLMLLFNRGHRSGSNGIVAFGECILLKLVPRRRYFSVSQFFAKRGRRWNGNPGGNIIFPVTIRDCKRYYPADLYEGLQMIPFQGKAYSAYRNAGCFLATRYGNFMQLPPKEEQVWKHPPLLVDYTRNYEELPPEEQALT